MPEVISRSSDLKIPNVSLELNIVNNRKNNTAFFEHRVRRLQMDFRFEYKMSVD